MATTRSILLVEDEEALREMVTDALSDAGHVVQDASNAMEALDRLRSGACFDVLLTDMGMPGMSGLELAMEARTIRPDIVVIIASGFAKAQLPAWPPEFIYFPKPYRFWQLESLLADLAATPGPS